MAFIRRHRAGLLVTGTAAAVLVGGGVALAAASSADGTVASRLPGYERLANPTVSTQQAEDAARQAVPGATVEGTDLDHDHGATVWEVDVRNQQGVEYEVRVDAGNGTVLSVEQDDD
ncbi:PepSY domain-containing protein [Nocardia sp. CDC159]|uniref:PepSY domain-containing protein n=1 Tax=Nocardia pulmonis TaxID=2951408 RepID=A0A9X2J2T7_9NOCA|nr:MULTISPECIES: PepSY domain-containing protein [Nocardia]MCM6778376.1 PepSY domain-containing protein [Nocardia pulmonis]MCM6791228.1 PepSY domain-containing protein [Nocardia sp. CDC159]